MKVLGSQHYTSPENGLLSNSSVFCYLVVDIIEMGRGIGRLKKVE